MQYNESGYNGDSYNLTNYTSTLVETITPIDATVAKDIFALRIESQGTADTIGGSDTLQAFLETVTILQRALTPFPYNNGMYNQYMYNARMDEDEILLMATKVLVDSISSSDALAPFSIEHAIFETITDVDTITFSLDFSVFDFIFLSEYFRIEITNKALDETLQISDWLTIKQSPQSVEWFD
jgi:hypothetical protein